VEQIKIPILLILFLLMSLISQLL